MVKYIILALLTITTIKEANSEHRYNNTEQSRIEYIKTERKSSGCGIASFYNRRLSGRKTASGERYRSSGLTAASRTLRLGERIIVINPRNGRKITVRINDRGPARWTKRIIDLSEEAFKRIADTRQGIIRVCLKRTD